MRIKSLIKAAKHWFSRQKCYTSMENAGIAIFGCCSGLVGGDRSTDYLQCECISCPYYVDTVVQKAEGLK